MPDAIEDFLRQGGAVFFRREKSIFAVCDHLGDTGMVRADDGNTGGHRLFQNPMDPFLIAVVGCYLRQNKHIAFPQELLHFQS